MDGIELHKAYYSYLREPEYIAPERFADTRAEANLFHYQYELKAMKDDFMGLYGYLIHIVSPKLSRMRHMVYMPELGGHIEMTEDGYDDLLSQQIELYSKSERLFRLIQETERDVCEAYKAVELEKEAAVQKNLRIKFRDKIMESERWIGHRNPQQLNLF